MGEPDGGGTQIVQADAPVLPGRLPVSRADLGTFCRRHRIVRMALFGSVLRDDFGPDSDVDVLVDFAPDHHLGWGIVSVANELSDLFGGREVDLVSPDSLNRWIKHRVLTEARVIYDEG